MLVFLSFFLQIVESESERLEIPEQAIDVRRVIKTKFL